MKPSQRIYQQRDIAQNKADYYAELIANELSGIVTNEEITDEEIDRSSQVSERWAMEYIKWRTITKTLSTLGGRASNEEHQERKKKQQEYEAMEKVLVKKEELPDIPNILLKSGISEYMNNVIGTYLNTTTNTVTLNTELPTTATTGTTYTFTIPRFKVAPVEAEVIKGVEINEDTLIYDEVQEFMEEEVEGIV